MENIEKSNKKELDKSFMDQFVFGKSIIKVSKKGRMKALTPFSEEFMEAYNKVWNEGRVITMMSDSEKELLKDYKITKDE